MARIRGYEGVEPARQQLPTPQATADVFGGSVGQAAVQAGQTLEVLGVRIGDHRQRQDQIAAASLAARMAAEWEPIYHQLRTMQSPGSPGFADQVRDSYERFADERTAELTPRQYNLARPMFERARAQTVIRAAQHEAESAAGHNRLLAERGLAAGINLVATNPAAFNDALLTGNQLVDSLGLSGDVREEFRRGHVNALTKAVFENRIYNARTPAEIDAALAELARPEWRERATPVTYDSLLDQARSYRSTLAGRVDTAVRSRIDMLRDRLNDPRAPVIDPVEIAAVDQMVRASVDPGVQWQWAQLRVRHETLRTALRSDPSALAASINRRETHLALPAPVTAAIEEAARTSGGSVTASYLSQLVTSQSGEYVAAARRGRSEFALQAAHERVNLTDIGREVREAGARAGEIFGAPLRVTSGHRNPFYNARVGGAAGSRHVHGNALDIDTTGMDAATRGRLVDSLVQAGFTGFGQYGTHIHADMRAAVPGSFGRQPGYGGWTPLDPEVMTVLERRGFRAGRPSGEIDRTGATGRRAEIAQPERGVFGFDDATWLDVTRRNAEALGIAGMADADVLRLRQDPRTAARVATLYAQQNRIELQGALGRDVSDAELYMAHVLGPAGAVSLLRAVSEAPNAPVGDVVPGIDRRYPPLAGEGRQLTAGEVYVGLLSQFTGGVTALEHARMTAERDAQKQMDEARATGDIMSFGARAGHIVLSELQQEEDFRARGEQALQMQRTYRLEHPRPLRTDEVERFTNVIKTGSVADVTALITQLQALGPRAASGAYRQLGQTDEVFAHVAGLATRGDMYAATAREVMRGRIRLRDNPDARQVFTTAPGGTDNQFNLIVGGALDSADPRVRQAIREAADAFYIERFGSGQMTFDPKQYREAVQAVLGAAGEMGGLGAVNGRPVLLPQGITAREFDRALDGLTPADLNLLSVDGHAPQYRNGNPVNAVDVAYEGHFRAVGADTYTIVMADGMPLHSQSGQPYRITLTAETIRRLATAQPGIPDRVIPRIGGR